MDIGIERFSSPFFFEPMSSACIPSNILDESEDQESEPIHYGAWLEKSMMRFGEWKGYKSKKAEDGKSQI
jgi:isopenicillin N synthase-like dioxygenase